MKKLFLFLFGILPLATFAQSGKYIVNVNLKNLNKPTKAYLIYYNAAGKYIADSTISKNGGFQFQGQIPDIIKANLLVDHTGKGRKIAADSDVRSIYLESGKIELKGIDSVKNAIVSGAPVNEDYSKYFELAGQHLQSLEIIKAQAYATQKSTDQDEKARIDFVYGIISRAVKTLQLQFIKENPQSLISLEVLKEMSGVSMDLVKIEPLYSELSDKVKISPSGQEFAKTIAFEKNVAVGAMAPKFIQNDVNGKAVSLNEFKGKYVLIDFWASWCGPCRAENPNVVKLYNQYKGKGFTVVGISMDGDFTKNAWIKAIKDDGLEWTQLSDLKFTENAVAKLYGVKAIPQNVLIDPSGKIVGKNLRGKALEDKLKEILGS
ncbi:MAG: TlpA disulfide reductase family protein [Bacteroidota bacterium]